MKLIFNFHQSALIPYQKSGNSIKVLLITTRKNKYWTIPKGFVDPNLSPFESARKEAFEEAGISQCKGEKLISQITLHKKIGLCYLEIFASQVVTMVDIYPESSYRERDWFKLDDAVGLIKNREIADKVKLLPQYI
ncbi:MAG: NUDIX domain-containing protein [Ignavibacteriaceae bacterium]|nr:NUDIX domain-containing protein [Ignavibacteriaceae bacterium]